jgi:hypothetical protein
VQIRWAIQGNLGNSSENRQLLSACQRLGIATTTVSPIPFSDEIPDVPDDLPCIFYGSARLISRALSVGRWTPCAFFDDMTFRTTNWTTRYGDLTLNADASHMSMAELVSSDIPADEVIFLRPERDLKEFSGQLMSLDEYRQWYTAGDAGTRGCNWARNPRERVHAEDSSP